MESLIFNESHAGIDSPLEKPLLEKTSEEGSYLNDSDDDCPEESIHEIMQDKLAQVCATYLSDYENSRKTTLFSDSDYITNRQLQIYYFNTSIFWQVIMFLGTASFFASSVFEGNEVNPVATRNALALVSLNLFGILVYCADIKMQSYYRQTSETQVLEARNYFIPAPIHPSVYRFRRKKWNPGLILYFFILILEMIIFLLDDDCSKRCIWTGALKPVVFLYYSSKTRDAVKALSPTLPIVLQVIMLEMFMTFMFAVVAYHLYGNATIVFSEFHNLQQSFISMFLLSTTVVNPSLWISIYAVQKTGALFFVFFLIIMVFYMHSLVLTVVFKSYMKSIASIRKKKALKKEFVLRITFETLSKLNRYATDYIATPEDSISTKSLKKTLQYLRPHYNNAKIHTLIAMIDPAREGRIDMEGFRERLPSALKLALRNKREPNQTCAIAIDVFTTCLTLANLIYVIGISFVDHHMLKQENNIIILGFVITFLGALDLILRINPCHILPPDTAAKFDYVFDSISCIATLFSIYSLTRTNDRIRYLMMGRAIDMFRFTQFFPTFRDIIKTSGLVISLVLGPLVLVFFTVHIYCYIGMFLWGGRIIIGEVNNILPFFDHLNFNTYLSGMLTMFQVLVINDWNEIAKVFESLGRPWVVFTFFISAITICVTILLNAFISFFIAAFETGKTGNESESFLSFGNITTGFKRGFERSLQYNPKSYGSDNDDDSHDSSIKELNVYERQDVDEVLRRVTGEENGEKFSFKDILEFFETFVNLTHEQKKTEETGYLIFNHKTSHRHENVQFKLMTSTFMGNEELYNTICSMSVQVLADDMRKKETTKRVFESYSMEGVMLELSASPLLQESPVILFVAKIKKEKMGQETSLVRKEPSTIVCQCSMQSKSPA